MNGTNHSDAVNDGRADDDCDGRLASVNWMPLAMWLDGGVILSMVMYLQSLHCYPSMVICCAVNGVPI